MDPPYDLWYVTVRLPCSHLLHIRLTFVGRVDLASATLSSPMCSKSTLASVCLSQEKQDKAFIALCIFSPPPDASDAPSHALLA